MKKLPKLLDLSRVKVFPIRERESKSVIDEILVDPESPAATLPGELERQVKECAQKIATAHKHRAGVMLLYGAHLIKNGGSLIVNRLMESGWLTHLATNGAGTIHDWELAFHGKTEESVKQNVATGTFGTWDETGKCIHLALMAGALIDEGYGQSLGRMIAENGVSLPSAVALEQTMKAAPADDLSAARADLLRAIRKHNLPSGRIEVEHPWREHSVLGTAFRLGVPLTVHPGIGYDIIA
ncbi:MAG TPA: hypothetical protein VFC07_13245, partial [Verrucomicrobiae bacterium]|nr:hypothetical protein [Verrucomicrobiae bacterium]